MQKSLPTTRWIAAGLLLSALSATPVTAMAQGAAPKPGAKPAPAAGAGKTAPADAKAAPADAKAAPADAKAAAPADPKAGAITPAPSPADAEKEALRLIEEAKKQAKILQWDKMRDAAAAAFKLKADPAFGLVLGQAELKTGKPRDAAEHLDLFLREAKAASADDKATAQKLLDEAKGKIGTLYIKVSVEGADILVDGKAVGRSPLPGPLYLEVGSREIEIKKFGFQGGKELLVVAPATESEMESVLAAEAVKVAEQPKEPEKKKEEPPPPPMPKPKWWTYGLIGGGALTVLGLGLGVGLTVSANGKSDEADAQLKEIARTTPNTYGLCGTNAFPANKAACAQLKETLDSQDARANGAVFGYVLGGVAAVGTLGLFLLPKTPVGRKLMGVNVIPVLSGDQAGGMVVGTF